jgi:hypothetical protein
VSNIVNIDTLLEQLDVLIAKCWSHRHNPALLLHCRVEINKLISEILDISTLSKGSFPLEDTTAQKIQNLLESVKTLEMKLNYQQIELDDIINNGLKK